MQGAQDKKQGRVSQRGGKREGVGKGAHLFQALLNSTPSSMSDVISTPACTVTAPYAEKFADTLNCKAGEMIIGMSPAQQKL